MKNEKKKNMLGHAHFYLVSLPSNVTVFLQLRFIFDWYMGHHQLCWLVGRCVFGVLLFAMWQYLRRSELHRVVDNSNNPWRKLVAGSEHLAGTILWCLQCFVVDCIVLRFW